MLSFFKSISVLQISCLQLFVGGVERSKPDIYSRYFVVTKFLKFAIHFSGGLPTNYILFKRFFLSLIWTLIDDFRSQLPQQQNAFDCGFFLLHYVELFLKEAPENFNPFSITKFSNFVSGPFLLIPLLSFSFLETFCLFSLTRINASSLLF